ncbi:MAG TPA: isocitrate/isopropylmalate family dehydrogenase [Gaiellaceae bacterium]|jgi:3-isopropylmalate dehydrogenase|nr:isocitrate/isopropylmalate family dehydrogenase [Gaiellaceae bacterium]
MSRTKTVACLAGDGVGPELMAAAARALDRVSKLHALELDDVHLPFAGEGITRCGHALPASTRAAYRNVDAILVASPDEPAFEGVKADLDLAWRVARVHLADDADVLVFGPVGDWADEVALERAFSCAASRGGRVTVVGEAAGWQAAVDAEHARWAGMQVTRLTLGEALVRLQEHPGDLDVIATDSSLFGGIVDAAAHFAGSRGAVAQAWLPEQGPGVFAPGSSESDDVAGFGVADPSGMLLTASLLLGEGLKRRSAARTLERAVGTAMRARGNGPSETRSFADAVIELLPQTRTDLELFDEVRR